MKRKQYIVFVVIAIFFAILLVKPARSGEVKDNSGDIEVLLKKLVDNLIAITTLYSYDARLDDALQLLESNLERFKGELRMEDRLRLQLQCARMYLYKGSLNNTGHKKVSDILAKLEEPAGVTMIFFYLYMSQ